MSMTSIKSPTSPRLQRGALFMSQFTYEIMYKRGVCIPMLTVYLEWPMNQRGPRHLITDALMDDNFVNAVDLGIRESEFNRWLIPLFNENKSSYRFGCELLHYTAAIEIDDEKLNMAHFAQTTDWLLSCSDRLSCWWGGFERVWSNISDVRSS